MKSLHRSPLLEEGRYYKNVGKRRFPQNGDKNKVIYLNENTENCKMRVLIHNAIAASAHHYLVLSHHFLLAAPLLLYVSLDMFENF